MAALQLMDRHVISWIETTYHKSKAFPSHQLIREQWPRTFPTDHALEIWLASPVVKQALHNRGLNSNSNHGELTEAQAAAILVVANLSDRRGLSTKLKSLGITLAQWNAWKRQPSFKKFLYDQLNEDLDSSLDRVFSGLLNAVDKGDPRAVQLYLEMTGRQPTENERNFKLAVSRIIESITRHVKDPEVIRALAKDFEMIEQGRDPVLRLESFAPTGKDLGI